MAFLARLKCRKAEGSKFCATAAMNSLTLIFQWLVNAAVDASRERGRPPPPVARIATGI
jgi:hypothetical protein